MLADSYKLSPINVGMVGIKRLRREPHTDSRLVRSNFPHLNCCPGCNKCHLLILSREESCRNTLLVLVV